MSHGGQFYKFLFHTNTSRARERDIVFRVNLGTTYRPHTPYRKFTPRYCRLLTVNVYFDIMP